MQITATNTQIVAFADYDLRSDYETFAEIIARTNINFQQSAMIGVGLHDALVNLLRGRIQSNITWNSICEITSEDEKITIARVIAVAYDGGVKLFVMPLVISNGVTARRVYVFHYIAAFETEETIETPSIEMHNTYKFYCARFECSLLDESSTLGSIADTIATYGHEKNLWRKRK